MLLSTHHPNKQVYVITHDVGERIQGLRHLGLKTPDANDPFFTNWQEALRSRISRYLPNVDVVAFDMKALVNQVWAKAFDAQSGLKDSVIVSSCSDVSGPRHGHTLEINRIVDETGEIIGLGSRPGHAPLSHQVNVITKAAEDGEIIIVEDGAFTGSTISHIVKLFNKDGSDKVHAIILGLCFPGAVEAIRSETGFQGEITIIEEIEAPYEWMPDHDFIPFAPNCGRVFGGKFGPIHHPFYSHHGFTFSFPYIEPFGDPVKWASIPQEHSHDFSNFCMYQAQTLFRMLDEMNGRCLTMHDFKGASPHVSLPLAIGADMPDTEVISECLEVAVQDVY